MSLVWSTGQQCARCDLENLNQALWNLKIPLNVKKKCRRRSQPSSHLQQKHHNLISLFSMNPPALDNSLNLFYWSLPNSGNIQDNVW